MGERYERAILAVLRAPNFQAEVVDTVDLTPHMRRIRFAAPELLAGVRFGPTGWVRLWIPADGHLYQRGYTLTAIQRDEGTFDVDFLLHEPAGPASRWAIDATPGQRIDGCVYGTDDYTFPEPEPSGHLFVGDAASLPAINSVLAAAPASSRIVALLHREHAEDEKLPVIQHPGADVRWIDPVTEGDTGDSHLDREIADLGPELTTWRCWVALDSTNTRTLVKRLRGEYRVPKQQLKSRAYWARGRSMGTAAPE